MPSDRVHSDESVQRRVTLQRTILSVCQQDHATKEKVLQSMAAMSSAQIVSASAMHDKAMAIGLVGGMLSPSAPMGPAYPGYGPQVNHVHVYASSHASASMHAACFGQSNARLRS